MENKNDHTMIRIRLHGIEDNTTVNAMIDSGATEDFIDQEFCNKHQIKTIKAKNSREIYLADGESNSMGPVTRIARYLWTSEPIGKLQPSKWQNSNITRQS